MEGPLGTHSAEAKSVARSGFCTRPSSTHSLQGYYYHYAGQCNNILNGPNLAASYS